jgi:hypothetical protein
MLIMPWRCHRVDGIGGFIVERHTTRFTPASIAACSTLSVPSTLVFTPALGELAGRDLFESSSMEDVVHTGIASAMERGSRTSPT